MKKIRLTRGQYAIVDNSDYAWLNEFKWCASKRRSLFVAVRRLPNDENGNKGKLLLMHHAIMKAKPIDHINGNPLDNRRSNLRACSHSENACNRRARSDNASGFKGVSHSGKKSGRVWCAEIQYQGKRIRKRIRKRFATIKEAVAAYREMAIKIHGEFARW